MILCYVEALYTLIMLVTSCKIHRFARSLAIAYIGFRVAINFHWTTQNKLSVSSTFVAKSRCKNPPKFPTPKQTNNPTSCHTIIIHPTTKRRRSRQDRNLECEPSRIVHLHADPWLPSSHFASACAMMT